MAMSQLDDMREVIQTELVPRAVKVYYRTAEGFLEVLHGSDRSKGRWTCDICRAETEYDPATAHNPLMAKHTTFCKLGNVLGVVE